MKKLLALLTAIALLLCAAGLAEEVVEPVPEEDGAVEVVAVPTGPALTTELRNVTLTTSVGGRTEALPLDDLWASATLDTTDRLQAGIGVYQGVEALAFVQSRLEGDRLQLSFDGLDATYETAIPGLAGQNTFALPLVVRALLPTLMVQSMAPIHAFSFPKLDLTALAQPYVVDTRLENGATIRKLSVPEAQVAEALERLSAEVSASADRFPDAELLSGLLDSYRDSGVHISLDGAITDRGYEQTSELDVMITSNGEAAESPTFVLNTRSIENSFEVSFGMPNEGNTYELARFAIDSDTETDTMALTMNAMGVLTADVSIAPDRDGMQTMSMNVAAFGNATRLRLEYGFRDEQYVVSVSGDNGPRGSFQIDVAGQPDEMGAFVGLLSIFSYNGVRRVELEADFTQRMGESGLDGRAMPREILPIDALTSDDLAYAFEPLTETLGAIFGAEQPQP